MLSITNARNLMLIINHINNTLSGNVMYVRMYLDGQRPACVNGKGSCVITGWPLIRHQFLALFIKRFHHARRSRKGIIAQVAYTIPYHTTKSAHFAMYRCRHPWLVSHYRCSIFFPPCALFVLPLFFSVLHYNYSTSDLEARHTLA